MNAIFPGHAGKSLRIPRTRSLDQIVLQALAAERLTERWKLTQCSSSTSLRVEQQTEGGGCHGCLPGKMRKGAGALLDGPRAQRIVVTVSGFVTYTNNTSVRLNPRRKQKVHGC
ncbi:MAG: hypothetical protein RMJ98_06210 [Myxococcales bacterium]|nr:hypothetical protein [Polyangiaceae bacterium]MDW8248882.1 hypothetical protein [Myxococcales bacterium]